LSLAVQVVSTDHVPSVLLSVKFRVKSDHVAVESVIGSENVTSRVVLVLEVAETIAGLAQSIAVQVVVFKLLFAVSFTLAGVYVTVGVAFVSATVHSAIV
jgi:hypothetical protein